MTRMIPAALRAVERRFPGLRPIVLAAWGFVWRPVFGLILLPFRFPQRRGAPVESAALAERATAYNEAAERYYAEYADPRFLLEKPFSDAQQFGRYLVNTGTLIAGAKLRPGDTVVELGAGTCWLSHLLNRFRCRTIALDVSGTALALGRELFESDPRTNWSLDPKFLTYDGHAFPLDDATCDRVIVYDAFHHVPNQREILGEMHRVLTPDGVVAMSEPGRGHASRSMSVRESASTDVLENELIVEDLAALAEAVGFSAVNVIATGPTMQHELPARDIERFTGGARGFHRYWDHLCNDIYYHHYVLMYKGGSRPTTARPGQLAARIRVVRPGGVVSMSRTERLSVDLRIANIGDTRWLHQGSGASRSGWTRVGVHLHEAGDPAGKVIDFDWCRVALDRDVEPDGHIGVQLDLPAIDASGVYDARFDLVVEGFAWFAEHGGASPAVLRMTVE